MFDVLMFLFESYISGQFDFKQTVEDLDSNLRRRGFRPKHIRQALDWIDQLSTKEDETLTKLQISPTLSSSMRIFAPWEVTRISLEARGMLMTLEQCGILDSNTRERIIDQALALDIDYIECQELKLIVLMVLGAHLESNRDIAMLQEFILSEQSLETTH